MKKTVTLLSYVLTVFHVFPALNSTAQTLPYQMTYLSDDHRLTTGGVPLSGFYDEMEVNTIELFFDEPNYWSLLDQYYPSATDLGATAIINDDTLASKVGVRFKGTTSYILTQGMDKKSFNITLDFLDEEQDYEGYETLNLNNSYQDPSFIREVMFYHMARKHIPVANANFIQLYINGESWGLYPNIQQLNGEFYKEWFLSNEGTSWRAIDPDFSLGGPGGGGNPFGTGFSSMNWLGNDIAAYQDWYTLKRTSKVDPWADLLQVCDVLNNTSLDELEVAINEVLNLDQTLWMLAHEIVFSDDDGYAYKGGMDYYLYWEAETGRMVPHEYDANSCMKVGLANWSPFFHADNESFALMNRLFAVPEIRQRYLAHVRTIIDESLHQETFDDLVDLYYEHIDELVEGDNKKIYTYADFMAEKEELKTFAQARRDFLLADPEVNAQGPQIGAVSFSVNGQLFEAPDPGQVVSVKASVSGMAGVSKVRLYHGTGWVGKFSKTEMYDDGAHDDGAAGDGVFGAEIPGYGNGTPVRFYIEAIADDEAKTVSYDPAGAEHDVYIYRVNVNAYTDSDVVVNELMARNKNTVEDPSGEFDDWIELYNNSGEDVDLSGWYLTDDADNLGKWYFPEGTLVEGGGYLIVWADGDIYQPGLHANFKLSGSGEELYLLNPDLEIAQVITYGEQEQDKGLARIPNGTGDFFVLSPTFGGNNEEVSSDQERTASGSFFNIFPSPASDYFTVSKDRESVEDLKVFDLFGRIVFTASLAHSITLDVSGWRPGFYFVQIGDRTQKIIVE